MTAVVLQGAPVTTVDLDLVHRRTPENIDRLLRVLAHLAGPGHQLLTTNLGDLDCLGTIGDGMGYGRPKDLAALPVLRATLDELKRRS